MTSDANDRSKLIPRHHYDRALRRMSSDEFFEEVQLA